MKMVYNHTHLENSIVDVERMGYSPLSLAS